LYKVSKQSDGKGQCQKRKCQLDHKDKGKSQTIMKISLNRNILLETMISIIKSAHIECSNFL